MDISTPKADLRAGPHPLPPSRWPLTVFAEKLYAVFGMQYLDGKLYVLHNPKFTVFPTTTASGTIR